MVIYAFVISLALFGLLFAISREKYIDFLAPLDKSKYSLKNFMPMSLFLLEKIKYKYNTVYDQGLQLKLGELYEQKNARYYLQVHWSSKLTLMLIMIPVILFFGTAMGDADSSFAFFSITALGLAFYLPDHEVNEKLKKRRLMLQIDFPDFLNKLMLLVNAGMTISRAMEKIVMDRQTGFKYGYRPLYSELHEALLEIKAGRPESKAYENLAKRCKTPEITKFTSVIIQNLRKGNAELVSILRLQAVECWEMRKNVAKKLGEEASTKLLFPMMIMFLAILLIAIAPAFMQLQGF